MHPSTAQGISHVKLLAANNDEFTTLVAQLSTVVGAPPSSASHGVATWYLETPKPIAGLHTKLILEDATLALGALDTSKASASEKGLASGIHEVGFWVTKGGGVADSPYGKIVWTPIP